MLERTAVALDRIRAGLAARPRILYGLRGVGKTVLLTAMRDAAEEKGMAVVAIEASENRSLPGILLPALRVAFLRLDRMKQETAGVARALKALAGFAKLKVKYDDLEVPLDFEPEPGLADSGDLDADLSDLIVTVGEAAQEQQSTVVLVIDELQYVPEEQLAALIGALHRAAQKRLPVTMLAAGLPQLIRQIGRAKPYAQRLFEFVTIGPLDEKAACDAVRLPIEREEETIEKDALDAIFAQTQGYPYFLQEWGKHSWDAAEGSPITVTDVEAAAVAALAELDASFFRVRFDRLTSAEMRYLRAMADRGAGPHSSRQVAETLGVTVSIVAPTRNSLIAKGMLYSPAGDDTAFTAPLFDAFMRRVVPG
ncbi:hypothetical protein HNO88_004241 [Novosphingobium chloroacetimidivorans]|uniref:Orc1-like AAA ATPase domain-containing protein n=1 Tax=Novosphingobium chloroacetimidivorans TaxID=1428314 RepID=A0A7W7KE85_9SPHN|nr:ATP-binding protein [Novosphingobium chloroacetimidivorans]MBB4860895.1 hypothetical protein [Novosphingobium chloroacetimidivorans]